jgi:hypothetical protein
MQTLLLQLFGVFAPIVKQIIDDHHAAHGKMPTDAEMQAAFASHIDLYLQEGAQWQAAQPKVG